MKNNNLKVVDGNHIKGVNEKNHLEGMGSGRFPFLKQILEEIATNSVRVTSQDFPVSHFFGVKDNGEIKGLSYTKNRMHLKREMNIDIGDINEAVRKMKQKNDYSKLKPLIVVRFPNGDVKLLNGNHTVGMVYKLGRSEVPVCELDFIKDLNGSESAAMEIAKAANIHFVKTNDFTIEDLRDQYLDEYNNESDIWVNTYDGRTKENIAQHKRDFIADNPSFFTEKSGANVISGWLKHHAEDGCFSRVAVRQWDEQGQDLYVGELKQELDDNNELVRDGWVVLNPRVITATFNTGTAEFANLAGREDNPKFKAIVTLYCSTRSMVRQMNNDNFVNDIIRKTRVITRNMNIGCAYDKFGLKVHFMPYGDDDNLEAMERVNKLNKRVETPESEW